MAKTVNKHRAEHYLADMSDLGRDMCGLNRIYLRKGGTCPVHLRGTKLDETWTQGSSQHKKQVPKEVFPKSKDFPSDFE
jgi:hypothetical protein